MLRRIFCPVLLIVLMFTGVSNAAENDAFSTVKGTWITIYINDFVGMKYAGGVTKNAACVSEAKKKSNEFMEKGMTVRIRLLMNEMAAFDVSGPDNFLIYCNANGALVVDMLVSGAVAEAMARRETSGTPSRSGEAPPTVTRTQIDLQSGKATSTTLTPNN